MVSSSQQQRCVFVGNIPYDATEEQLIEICREVGPVISFRLVVDRETGKPKGYGFCEYKDEETALSARRNLQGYEINGRQLRVDFAENGKNTDKNKEQGRSGPGLATNVDPQKQVGGPSVIGESSLHQPIGLHSAITAATVMAGALGGAQTGLQSNPSSLLSQSAPSSDPLTLHLAKMSRSQLHEIISEFKAMATQNRDAALQLLNVRPQLSKALFQVQIMLGMVTPQVLQVPNLRRPPGQPMLPSSQKAPQGPLSAVPNVPGMPPLVQRAQMNMVPKLQDSQVSFMPQNSLIHGHFSTESKPSMLLPTQISQQTSNNVPPPVPHLHPTIRPQIQVASSSSLNQQVQPTSLQHPREIGIGHSAANNTKIVIPNGAVGSARFPSNESSVHGNNAHLKMQNTTLQDPKVSMSRPSKLLKLDDGRSTTFPSSGLNVSTAPVSGQSQGSINSVPAKPLPKPEELQHSDKQVSQLQLSPDMESALLQQVLSLTPEQLRSLPPEQQQQVIQLQQALRREN